MAVSSLKENFKIIFVNCSIQLIVMKWNGMSFSNATENSKPISSKVPVKVAMIFTQADLPHLLPQIP